MILRVAGILLCYAMAFAILDVTLLAGTVSRVICHVECTETKKAVRQLTGDVKLLKTGLIRIAHPDHHILPTEAKYASRSDILR
jgi:hypothetical protein